MHDVYSANGVSIPAIVGHASSSATPGDPLVASCPAVDDHPRTCPECHRSMILRELRDYGIPGEPVRQVVRIVRWECVCGDTEVIESGPVE
jgi:hypothetical protein